MASTHRHPRAVSLDWHFGHHCGSQWTSTCFTTCTLSKQYQSLATKMDFLTPCQLPANLIIFTTTILSTTISIIALAFTSYLNSSSSKPTLQSWTCMWRDVSNESVPRQFDTLCHETVGFHRWHTINRRVSLTLITSVLHFTPQFLAFLFSSHCWVWPSMPLLLARRQGVSEWMKKKIMNCVRCVRNRSIRRARQLTSVCWPGKSETCL